MYRTYKLTAGNKMQINIVRQLHDTIYDEGVAFIVAHTFLLFTRLIFNGTVYACRFTFIHKL